MAFTRKFQRGDEVTVIKGRYEGSIGKITSYDDRDRTYRVFFEKIERGVYFKSHYLKKVTIKLDKSVDYVPVPEVITTDFASRYCIHPPFSFFGRAGVFYIDPRVKGNQTSFKYRLGHQVNIEKVSELRAQIEGDSKLWNPLRFCMFVQPCCLKFDSPIMYEDLYCGMNVKVKENIKDIAPKDFASKVYHLAGRIFTVSNFTKDCINLQETGLLPWKYEYLEAPKLGVHNCLSDFTIGTRVRVKEDLKERHERISSSCPDDFAKWAGKEGTIIGKVPTGFLTLAEDPKRWHFWPNDLEILEDSESTNKFKVGDKVRIKGKEAKIEQVLNNQCYRVSYGFDEHQDIRHESEITTFVYSERDNKCSKDLKKGDRVLIPALGKIGFIEGHFSNNGYNVKLSDRSTVHEPLEELYAQSKVPSYQIDDYVEVESGKYKGSRGKVFFDGNCGTLVLLENNKTFLATYGELKLIRKAEQKVVKEEKSEGSLFIEKVEVISPTYKSPVIELEDLPVLGYFKS